MKKKSLIFAVSFVIFILACQSVAPSPTVTPPPTETFVPTSTSMPTATFTPTATLTFTPIPPTPSPSLLTGNWTGIEGYEDGHLKTQVSISIKKDCSIGSMCGVIAYPEFSCRGNLFLEKIEDQTFVFLEVMEAKCQSIDKGYNHLRLLEDGTLALNYIFANGNAGASGILKKQ